MWKLTAALVVVSSACASCALAQDDVSPSGGLLTDGGGSFNIFGFDADSIERPFKPDRPRSASSVGVIPVGRFSLEAGTTFTFDDQAGVEVRTLAGPELLLRTGIIPRLEGRIGWGGQQAVDVETTGFSDRTTGATDMTAGVKFDVVTENTKIVPAVAVVVEASLPIGAEEFSSDRIDPSAEVVFDYNNIHDIFGVSGSLKLTSLENQTTNEEFLQTSASASFDQVWNDEFETFVEYFAFFNDDDGIDDAHFVQSGVIMTVAPNITLDARVGMGITSESSDFFAGAGGSVSF